MPRAVQREFGFALHLAQIGAKHPSAKVLRDFRSAGVLEVVENFATNTYRAVIPCAFREPFMSFIASREISKRHETPRPDRELIHKRLDDARRLSEGD